MDLRHVMQAYERAHALTRRMHEAAQAAYWDDLVDIEKQRDEVIGWLRTHDREQPTDAAMIARKKSLIVEIMAMDDEVKLLTQDWMRELREVLGTVSAEQKLKKAYGG